MNVPKKIILHHSLTRDGKVVDFNAIKKYHIETRGWKDIGYQYIIENVEGQYKIFKGRDEKVVGAHTLGQNAESIGICLVGNFDLAPPPKAQMEKLYELLEDIFDRYGKLPIYGHNHFSSKTCPGTKFPMQEVLTRMFDKNSKKEEVSPWAKESWGKAIKKEVNDGEGPKNYVTEEQLMVFLDRLGLLD